MSRILIVILALVASICVADAFGIGQGNRFGKMGASPKGGGAAAPLTNLRITNSGAFRVTNTSTNRAIFP